MPDLKKGRSSSSHRPSRRNRTEISVQYDNCGDDRFEMNKKTGAFLAASSDFSKKNSKKKIYILHCGKAGLRSVLSHIYPLVASGEEAFFSDAQTSASESKALHGWHIIASDSSDGSDRGSLWVSIQPHARDNTGEMGGRAGQGRGGRWWRGRWNLLRFTTWTKSTCSRSISDDFLSCFLGYFFSKRSKCAFHKWPE